MLVVVFDLPRRNEGGEIQGLAGLPDELLGRLAGNAVNLRKSVWSEHLEGLGSQDALVLQELDLPRLDAGQFADVIQNHLSSPRFGNC